MKKLTINTLITTFVTIIVITILVSCRKSDLVEIIPIHNKNLHEELIQLNSRITEQTNCDPVRKEGSNFWNNVKRVGNVVGKVCAIAGSDITGAAAGVVATSKISAAFGVATGGTGAAIVSGAAAVICGTGASYATGKALCNNVININQNDSTWARLWDYQEIGEKHNMCLYYKNNDTNYNISAFVLSLDSIPTELFYLEEWSSFILESQNFSTNYVDDELSINELMNLYLDNKYLSSNIYEVLLSFFSIYLYVDNLTEIDYIIESYVNFIENTNNLLDIEKEALLSALAVANYSPFYWVSVVTYDSNN